MNKKISDSVLFHRWIVTAQDITVWWFRLSDAASDDVSDCEGEMRRLPHVVFACLLLSSYCLMAKSITWTRGDDLKSPFLARRRAFSPHGSLPKTKACLAKNSPSKNSSWHYPTSFFIVLSYTVYRGIGESAISSYCHYTSSVFFSFRLNVSSLKGGDGRSRP